MAQRVDRFVQKEMLHYLRGRTRESVLGEIRAGALEGGWKDDIPVYIDEPAALAAELDRTEAAEQPEVIFLLCHEDREGVYDLIERRGLAPVEDPAELARLVGGSVDYRPAADGPVRASPLSRDRPQSSPVPSHSGQS